MSTRKIELINYITNIKKTTKLRKLLNDLTKRLETIESELDKAETTEATEILVRAYNGLNLQRIVTKKKLLQVEELIADFELTAYLVA